MARKNPVRVIRSGLTGTVYALTNYREREDGLITVVGQGKHDVSADVEAIVADRCAPLVHVLSLIADEAPDGEPPGGGWAQHVARGALRAWREREGGATDGN